MSGRTVYTYTGNDPLDRTDPSGKYICVPAGPGRESCTSDGSFVDNVALLGHAISAYVQQALNSISGNGNGQKPDSNSNSGNSDNNGNKNDPNKGPPPPSGKETGSYTNTHESGKTYSGKGDRARSQESGRRVENETGDKHTATDWTRAPTTRDAFKQEAERIKANGGPKSDENYNKIESPGKNMLEDEPNGTP